METPRLKVFLFVCLISIMTATAGHARDVTLQWSANTETTLAGYKVYYKADSAVVPFNGTGSGQGASPVNVLKQTSATLTGLDPARSYYFAVTAYDSSGAESVYSSVVSVSEAVAPTVAIAAPATNTVISGTASISVSASDNVGVSKVELYRDGALVGTDTATPYLFSLNTSLITVGSHTLVAKAYDAAGNVGQSSTVTVTVATDTTPPVVSITSPAANAIVSGNTSVQMTATDNIGVAKVELYLNGALYATYGSAPYTVSWNTTTVANGIYTMTAKAYDATGNSAQSAPVPVTVKNTVGDITPPTVAISSPVTNTSVSGTVVVTASASDNVGVSRVEFYVNGALQSTDTTSPYTFSWNTASVANGAYTVTAKALDATGNAGQSSNTNVSVNNTVTPPTGTITAVFGNGSGSNYTNTVEDTFLNINNDLNAAKTTLNTYTWPAGKPANSILMKWNLSALPANAQIQSATLNLYLSGSSGDALYEIPVSGIINKTPILAKSTGNTYDGINAWTASSVPYNSIPLAQSDIGPAADAPLIDKAIGYKSWNVTNIIKDWVLTPANNKGFLLNSSLKAGADSSRTFVSSEAADANQRPKLVVTYTLGSDTTTPSVSINNPANNATVSGTVTIGATASDNIGVTRVEYYLNGILNSIVTAPYNFGWNTTAVANGSYSITAKAYDAAGNMGQSVATTVTVNNLTSDTSAPAVSVTAPGNNATVSGTVSVAANASDNVGVNKVEFYVNGILQATDISAPYNFSWNTASMVNGIYSLIAKAFDAAGNSGSSSTVTLTVSNPVTPAISTIWPAATVPGVVDAGSSRAAELGVKFRSDVKGYITGIRFYKAATNTGTHVANLWTRSGTRLATATFTNETASGWQQVNFAKPVAISANTVYVASYHTRTGHYSQNQGYFTGMGMDSPPLHALASGVYGSNGVYRYSSTSRFPTQSNLNTNYWVDVVFKP